MPKTKTKAEREHLGKVAALPCVVNNRHCGGPVEVHHKTGAGMGLKSSHFDTIPLCRNHHTAGGFGIALHAGVKTWEENYGTQDHHIEQTNKNVKKLYEIYDPYNE